MGISILTIDCLVKFTSGVYFNSRLANEATRARVVVVWIFNANRHPRHIEAAVLWIQLSALYMYGQCTLFTAVLVVFFVAKVC